MDRACEAYRDDLVAEACGALPQDESAAVARHVAECAACREDLLRLRGALAPLDTYAPAPPPRLVEMATRRVARQMTMRLPRAAWAPRRRLVRLAVAAVLLVGFLPVVDQAVWASRRQRTTAQLMGLWNALREYAERNSDHLPPAGQWSEALRPFLSSGGAAGAPAWPGDLIFMEGLTKWSGLSDDLPVACERRGGPDRRRLVLYHDGRVILVDEADLRRLGRAP